MNVVETGLAAALVAGLVGSVHCLGMCGGIAGALGMAGGGRASLAVSYSAGRIASYAVAGALIGAIGGGLAGAAGLGPWLRLLMAVVLVLLGLQVALNLKLLAQLEAAGAGLWRRLAPVARRFIPPRHAGQALALGALWGWLLYVVPGEAIVWIAHKDNIERLLAGEERKFQPGDRQPTAPPGSEAPPSDEDGAP
ncbi:MAG: sulfite exporter TauE/SafE family protein [Candidatus Limnocylindrales bacterium]